MSPYDQEWEALWGEGLTPSEVTAEIQRLKDLLDSDHNENGEILSAKEHLDIQWQISELGRLSE